MANKTEIDSNKLQELEMLSSIAKWADNSILLLEKNGTIKWVNDAFKRLYGYDIDGLNKNKNNESTDFLQVLNDTDSNFFLKNSSLSFSRKITTNAGDYKWIQSTMTPTLDKIRQTKQFIVVETDITQQKEIEEELVQRWENTQTLTEHLESVKDYVEDQIDDLTQQKRILQEAKDKSEEVLNKVLPYEVAVQLKKKGYAAPRHYKKVTILNINIRNFFQLTDIIPIDELVKQLHDNLVTFDNILESHFVEKIKTVGGTYIGAGGVPLRNRSNPIDVVLSALEIRKAIALINKKRTEQNMPTFNISFAIHTGNVIAGVVGENKLSYDIWGDTVNIASAIENNIPEGEIFISETTLNDVVDFFDIEERPDIVLESVADVKLFEVKRMKNEFAKDASGIEPNSEFMRILSKL